MTASTRLVVATLTLAASMPGLPLAGQDARTAAESTATPDEAAAMFLRAVRGIRWDEAARLVHPETLDRFRLVVRVISDPDSTGEVRRRLVGTDSAGFEALPGADVFARALSATMEEMPGLMHAVFDRDDHVLGYVAEGPTSAHAVYRTEARITGATPEVKVMQLGLTSEGWMVRWSDELEVMEAAMRGVARPARTPPGHGRIPGADTASDEGTPTDGW